jgi:hypothetical protein
VNYACVLITLGNEMETATTFIKRLLCANPRLTNPQISCALEAQGHVLSDLVVAITRADFLRTVKFLQDRNLLTRDLLQQEQKTGRTKEERPVSRKALSLGRKRRATFRWGSENSTC